MIEIFSLIFGLIALGGGCSAIMERNPFNKLVGLSVAAGGIFPFIIDGGYLDIAIAIALLIPVTTIIILQLCIRGGRDDA